MKKRRRNRKITPQFFNTLPSEIIIDILSRLSVRTITICKCVCRSWLDLLRTREFADFHFSKSATGILVHSDAPNFESKGIKFYEIDDEHHDLRCKPLPEINSLDSHKSYLLQFSANGLLLMRRGGYHGERHDLYICNPVTREYIELPYDRLVFSNCSVFIYGFGVSRVSGQYKVVSIFHERRRRKIGLPSLRKVTRSICQVYTLGTGIWRAIKPPPTRFERDPRSFGVCLNGNIHWLVRAVDGSLGISCFDLETETFGTLSLPLEIGGKFIVDLVVLGDCLCACDNGVDEIVFWLLKEYEDEKSWTKELVIRKDPRVCCYDDYDGYEEVVHPIKVLKDGDILMAWQNNCMIYYSSKTKTIKQLHEVFADVFDVEFEATRHTLSFVSLSRFVNESVSRF